MTDEQKIERVALLLLTTLGDLDTTNAKQHLKATEHSGDCTKDPWTCLVCYADEHRRAAEKVIALGEKIRAEEAAQHDEFVERARDKYAMGFQPS
jgi:hypothetical protein